MTTPMNSAAIRNSHRSGATEVSHVLSALTEKAPSTAPTRISGPISSGKTVVPSEFSAWARLRRLWEVSGRPSRLM